MKKLILLFLLITTAVLTSCEDEKKSEPDDSVYALVNIPFAKFFATEATEGFDAYSSATQKAGNGNMSYGTYHTQSVVTEAVTSGITFPVNISRELLVSLGGNEVTDDSPSLDITTSARQTTSTIRYSKEQLLFQNKDYSYYILKDAPSYYKEASGSTGNVFFGKTKGEEKDIGKLYVAIAPGEAHHNFSPAITLLKPVDENTAEEETLSVKKFTFEGGSEAYTVTAGENGSETLEPKTLSSLKTIVATDTEGKSYGLTTLQNMFWGKSQMGFQAPTVEINGEKTYYPKHALVGKTIAKLTFYTEKGIYTATDFVIGSSVEDRQTGIITFTKSENQAFTIPNIQAK